MSSEKSPTTVPIALEWVDPALLGMDPVNPAATELMTWCATALGLLDIDPANVRITITGDMVTSVRDRSTSDHHRENYDLRRSTGMVAAKTMDTPEGGHEVLMPHWMFDTDKTAEQRENCDALVKRTIVHEAQHVVMSQAGETADTYAAEPWARRNFLVVAQQVVDEYRAESAVPLELRTHDSGWDCLDVLVTLRDDLRSIVYNYQTHLDVGRLSNEVGQECQTAWKVFSYIAAERQTAEVADQPLSDAVLADPLWPRMVGEHWEEFSGILARIPSGLERIPAAELDLHVRDLATELQAWLATIGYRFVDNDEGSSEFRITHWDLHECDNA